MSPENRSKGRSSSDPVVNSDPVDESGVAGEAGDVCR
jgi:hypothetical protein